MSMSLKNSFHTPAWTDIVVYLGKKNSMEKSAFNVYKKLLSFYSSRVIQHKNGNKGQIIKL